MHTTTTLSTHRLRFHDVRQDAVIKPFLGAFNKRAAMPVGEAEELKIMIDGVPFAGDVSRTAGDVLTSEDPRIELLRPQKPQPPKGSAADATAPEANRPSLTRLLDLPPTASEADWAKVIGAFCAFEAEAASGDAGAAF